MSNYLILGGLGQIGSHFINNYIDLEKDCIFIIDNKNYNLIDSESIKHFQINASNPKEYYDVQEFFKEKNIKIDFFLFSIGINYHNNFFTSTHETFINTFDINLNSFYISLKYLYSSLSRHASIVAISSQNGIVGHENRIEYSPSKASLIQIVKNLTIDFSKDSSKDIRVNCISPGYIITENNKEFFEKIEGKKLIKRNPYKKIVTLKDVCDSINFLFSESSYAIRGQNIIVDFGYTIQ
ncbi:NAD(P)-dependent dehydrogenase (short-subunit alcohol dehydrogenase family) [Staphylococcus epidermidis]|uniref:SDR family oxidoreductase n=1 Tax=Staphylococcus epidermidis TaxID=1282 RepID=UPI00138AB049|nr:SDR family oxidoreductase [Staphylococcus epidermidis]MBM0848340.1 SDR family oxidoreductase [Staphylococcus epidermidis]MBM6228455.1 SDR family oxidoreductase [Staphylococcus epidermidis]MBM6233092.1 SDR family oxidoreductase [Staphylococcus epidermidis]MBM6235371.1 SDR family oxidoreductase [Staphylococcus epidermidis]MBM6237690.1 SDR family oxidoreductase [Staphylococcus epidermidis]